MAPWPGSYSRRFVPLPVSLVFMVLLQAISGASAFGSRGLFQSARLHRTKDLLSLVPMTSSSSSQTTASYSASTSQLTPVPRAAVSTVVRFDSEIPTYLLIERGNPPNKGVWCVPGGKIDMGEPTLAAAQRELAEEVKFVEDEKIQVAWFSGAFCTSDSIIPGNEEKGKPGFHYLIAQCFAEIVTENDNESKPPNVEPADDAQAAKWLTLDEIRQAEANKETVPNLVIVIERAESLYQCGMLPTTHSVT